MAPEGAWVPPSRGTAFAGRCFLPALPHPACCSVLRARPRQGAHWAPACVDEAARGLWLSPSCCPSQTRTQHLPQEGPVAILRGTQQGAGCRWPAPGRWAVHQYGGCRGEPSSARAAISAPGPAGPSGMEQEAPHPGEGPGVSGPRPPELSAYGGAQERAKLQGPQRLRQPSLLRPHGQWPTSPRRRMGCGQAAGFSHRGCFT